MNFYNEIINRNSYEFSIQYLGGINRLLLKGIKNRMLPAHDKSEKDENKNNNKVPEWITTLGYFITKDGILLTFTGKM